MRLLLALALTLSTSTALAKTVIHAGTVITGQGEQVLTQHSIIVEDNTIIGIEKGFVPAADGDELIDLSQHTVMPGLMDMHVHISYQHEGPSTYVRRFTNNPADYALAGAYYAKKTLDAGFTTVRNLGDAHSESIALRNAINKGITQGPRIFTTGKSIATTGGHADPSNGMAYHLRGDPGPMQGVVNGIADARKAVRQRYKDGADLIKITATGGVLSLAKNGQNPQFMMDELKAIVDTARDYEMTVAVHAHGAEGMLRAVEAGVNSIEHGTYMTDEVMDAMKKNGTFYVPTILAGNFVAEKSKVAGFFPEVVRPKAAAIGPLIQNTFARAYKNGVRIAFGTDSGVSAHGDNAQEFALMVEAGMPELEAILSATVNTAELLGVSDTLGTIEAGKLADIVAVAGNPLENIRLLENMAFVMKGGDVVLHRL